MSNSSLVFDLSKLKERVDEVNPIDAQNTVRLLTAKLNKYDSLYALSAPQIGIKERVICFKYSNGKIKEFINPRIFKAAGYHLVRERDISIAEKEFISPRPQKIWIEYLTQEARPESNILKGNAAEIFDRMMQYLDGITLEDYGLEILEGFDEASEEEQQEIIDMYLKGFKTKEEELKKNIEQDEDASRVMKAIEFETAVELGKVTLEDI